MESEAQNRSSAATSEGRSTSLAMDSSWLEKKLLLHGGSALCELLLRRGGLGWWRRPCELLLDFAHHGVERG